jgi:eukaryotic-like serine/threonine-protein kinase
LIESIRRLSDSLAGRYAIEREIGAGGMATVYLARDLKHNRKVALKVLRPELAAVLGTERFLSEIQVTAGLQHPHLLPLFDSGEEDGQLFYVMPFIEGESLRSRLERERQLPVDEAIRISLAVASALDYAHRHRVIHRDLKPENILLHDGQPLVADFGIALAVSGAGGTRVTHTGISLGTPAYMSPEQATGDRQIDARADIYSLAAVTYEMLIGNPPHVASTPQALIAKVLTERPPDVRLHRETVPLNVDAAIQKALAKLPADRFASAEEFARALSGQSASTRSSFNGRDGAEGASLLRRFAPAAAAISLLIAAVVLVPLWPVGRGGGSAAAATVPSLFEVALPDSITLDPGSNVSPRVAVSRDGSQLVVRGVSRGIGALYSRGLGETDFRLVRGTESSSFEPHFSPDGNWLLFHTGAATKVPAAGGQPITLAESTIQFGLSWGDNDEVLVVRPSLTGQSLWRTSGAGRPPELLAEPDTLRGHFAYGWPFILPGAQDALITILKRGDGAERFEVGLVSMEDGPHRTCARETGR